MEGKLLFFGDPSPLFYARLHLGLGGRIGNRQAQRRQREELARKVLIGGAQRISLRVDRGRGPRGDRGAG